MVRATQVKGEQVAARRKTEQEASGQSSSDPSAEGAGATNGEATNGESASNGERKTSYIIFVSENEGGPWDLLGTISARSQDEARKLAIEGKHEDSALMSKYFIAISATSFKPKQPTVKTAVHVTF